MTISRLSASMVHWISATAWATFGGLVTFVHSLGSRAPHFSLILGGPDKMAPELCAAASNSLLRQPLMIKKAMTKAQSGRILAQDNRHINNSFLSTRGQVGLLDRPPSIPWRQPQCMKQCRLSF